MKIRTKIKIPYSLKIQLFFLVAIICTILLGVYIGNILFGQRSLEVLENLKKEKIFLYQDIDRLKKDNAKLQKTYLERRSLNPSVDSKN